MAAFRLHGPATRPGASAANPIVAQGRAILAAVGERKEGLVGQWRQLSQRTHAKDARKNLMAETRRVDEEGRSRGRENPGGGRPRTLR